MEADDDDKLGLEPEPDAQSELATQEAPIDSNAGVVANYGGDHDKKHSGASHSFSRDASPGSASTDARSRFSSTAAASGSAGLRLRIPVAVTTDKAFVAVTPAHSVDPLSSTMTSMKSQKRRRSSWDTRPKSAIMRKLDVEKSNDGGGGFTIRGFFVSTGCYVGMFVMAAFFFVAGAVMLAVSYSDVDEEQMEETNTSQEKHESKTSTARIIGPVLMALAIIVFVLALCLCILAYKATQAEREEHYFAKSNRISTISSPTELRSAEVFTPAISAVFPLTLLATPSVPVVLERSTVDSGRLAHLVSFQEQQQRAVSVGGGAVPIDPLHDNWGQHDPMHAVAPVHGRPRRNSLPGSLPQSEKPVVVQEEFRMPHYHRRTSRRASIISEARQELKLFRSSSARDLRRPRSTPPFPSSEGEDPPPTDFTSETQLNVPGGPAPQAMTPPFEVLRPRRRIRQVPTLPKDTATSRRDVACFPTSGPSMQLEVCQEATLPHIVVSDNPSLPSSGGASASHNMGGGGGGERKVSFRLMDQHEEDEDPPVGSSE